METIDIISLTVCLLFVLAVYALSRMERKLSDEKMNARFWKSEAESLTREMEVMKESVEYYKRELEEREAKYQELRERYLKMKMRLAYYVNKEGKEGETLPS